MQSGAAKACGGPGTFFLPDDDELPAAYQHELAYGARTRLDGMSIKLSVI